MNNMKPRISKETEIASTYGTAPTTVFSALICMYPVHIWLLLLHLPFYQAVFPPQPCPPPLLGDTSHSTLNKTCPFLLLLCLMY